MNLFDRLAQSPPAVVQEERTELDLIREYEGVRSNSFWEEGRLASEWHKKFARGRGDEDFVSMLSDPEKAESIRQKRRVWDKFSEFRRDFPHLTFSHYRAALAWPDWVKILRWANEVRGEGGRLTYVAMIREYNRRHGRGESILDSPENDGVVVSDDDVEDNTDAGCKPPRQEAPKPERKSAQPVYFTPVAPLAVVDENVQVGAATQPVKELKPDNVIVALRETLKPIAQYADDETRQQVGDELRSWLARIQPEVSLPTSDVLKELVTIPIFIDAWNKAEGTPYIEKLTEKREAKLKALLDDDNWRSTWRIGLQKMSAIWKKFPDWEPDIGWFLQPKSVKALIEGKHDDRPPNDNKPFTKPTVEEVRQYCLERQNGIDPEHWWNFYESKNWMIGKNKMIKWKKAVETWEKTHPKQSSPAPFRPSPASAASKIDDIIKRGDEQFGADIPEDEVPF